MVLGPKPSKSGKFWEKSLCIHKGIDYSSISTVDIEKYKEDQYDKLAEGIRNSLDMKAIYKILESGING